MKTALKTLTGVALMAVSLSAFADKISITGEPVVLEKRENIYYVPDTYKSTTTYHYVTVEGAKKVCYAEKQPNLARLNALAIDVSVGGSKTVWNCYDYDETYFTITP